MERGNVLLCAGGTGGHLFPAEAVAHELVSRGYTVHLATDERAKRFTDTFPAAEIHTIRSATFGSRNPIGVAKTIYKLAAGYFQSRKLIRKIEPVAVAGFGGYPTLPPLLAASAMKVPTLIHEANAVLGRANKFLSRRVSRVAIGFGDTDKLDGKEVTVTGNPVRPPVLEAASQAYDLPDEKGTFRLLVFGGSQGARYFGAVLPEACALMSEDHRNRLSIVQQARPEDSESLKAAYDSLGVQAEVSTFFTDMAERIASAHLVISRSGASTVSELAVIGRPAILVPYPYALDHDQAANAATVSSEGGAVIFKQSALVAEVLADELSSAINDPKRLALAAKNAKKTGKPNAAITLADMLEAFAKDGK
ncbi:MAG: undecaprenyldiphospho-muramoylpentapeptide beta-N-acetylglucosaminyltransferase [Pseudomonadota bacterium]